MGSVPSRLKDDCITEALLELRFTVDELDEITIGRLSAFPLWASFKKNRLPIAQIPQAIRTMDPGLQHQPTIELVAPDKGRRVRIGSSVISYHCLGRYVGWSAFQAELNAMIEHFYAAIGGVTTRRAGLRYVNILTPRRHHVDSFDSTALKLTVREQPLRGRLNVNFEEAISDSHVVMTRIATPHFVQGLNDKEAALVVDVDVYPPATFACNDSQTLQTWVEQAHTFEKQSFFRLFPDALVKSWEA